MHDLLVTAGITLLVMLIFVVCLFLWLFWTVGADTQQQHTDLMDRINRLKREEEELRKRVDESTATPVIPDDQFLKYQESLNQVKNNYTYAQFQEDCMKARRNERTER